MVLIMRNDDASGYILGSAYTARLQVLCPMKGADTVLLVCFIIWLGLVAVGTV